jgi:hypothetical protein
MANAMARGRAIIPIVMPARRSFLKEEREYPCLKERKDLGINSRNIKRDYIPRG